MCINRSSNQTRVAEIGLYFFFGVIGFLQIGGVTKGKFTVKYLQKLFNSLTVTNKISY